MRYTQHTRAGKAKENEDRILVSELTRDRLLAVMADGMGGLDHGGMAAEIAVNEIVSFFKDSNEYAVEESFVRALEKADNAIAHESARLGMKMGCAVSIVMIDDGNLHCTSLGNIRVLCNEVILTKDDVYTDPVGGTYLTNSLRGRGVKMPVQVIHQPLRAGWRVRICSDGFYNNDENDDASVIDIMK